MTSTDGSATRMGVMIPVSDLQRFSTGERWIHRSTAGLMLVCMITALGLDNQTVATLVGDRYLIATVHLYAGLALPVPIIIGALLSKSFRRDVRRLNRFGSYDWQWLKQRGLHVSGLTIGKFNAGQKLNSAFTVGVIWVMLVTGVVMYFPHGAQISWRTGATFVHDILALVIGIVVVGHIWLAANDPEARRGMRSGLVARHWAEGEHGKWASETESTTR